MTTSLRFYAVACLILTYTFMPQVGFSQAEEFGGEIPPEESQCEAPDVLLLLDRSGSMLDDDKWGQATRALSDVFVPYFDTLRFGLMTFPTSGSCGVTEGDLAIPIGEAQNANLDVIYTASQPTDEALTPLSEAIRLGHLALEEVREPQRRGFLILLTDGIETCAPEALEDSAPIAAAQRAANAGFKTYVIGFGSLVRRNTLRDMARVGGTEYERLASDQTQLSETLTAIIESTTTEICDRLDNDCDGRVDEGLSCESICNPEVTECPCNNNLDCRLGEMCVEGLCEPAPCDRLCDAGYVCYQEMCILEGTDPTMQPSEMTGGMISFNPNDMPQNNQPLPTNTSMNNGQTVSTGGGCNQRAITHIEWLMLMLMVSLISMSRMIKRSNNRC
jgi:hypothetical protein